MYTDKELTQFVSAYVECLLWAETGDNDEPLDANYDSTDIAPEAFDHIHTDCQQFLERAIDILDDCECMRGCGEYSKMEQAGHDFWLTRNGHGAGFWDGDWTHEDIDNVGDKLTDIAKKFPEQWPYIGDDGLIYFY